MGCFSLRITVFSLAPRGGGRANAIGPRPKNPPLECNPECNVPHGLPACKLPTTTTILLPWYVRAAFSATCGSRFVSPRGETRNFFCLKVS